MLLILLVGLPLGETNNGNAKKLGRTGNNNFIDDLINDAKSQGATNIRKNQQQVDINGNKVRNNRPDIQYDLNGIHHNIEVDTTKKGSTDHKNQIPEFDVNARNTFWLIDNIGYVLDGFFII